MLPGKLSAMAGHAYTDALMACLDTHPDRALNYRRNGRSGSKATLKAKNLGQLERIRRECVEAGLPHAWVTDKDHVHPPHFDGSEIVVAIGIGPCPRAECRHITKRYQAVE